jgi:nucleotide-binding universal stress UspA family protein
VVREGDPASEIVALAAEVGATLVVVGSRGRKGVVKTLLGSVSADVARRAPCSVLVVR